MDFFGDEQHININLAAQQIDTHLESAVTPKINSTTNAQDLKEAQEIRGEEPPKGIRPDSQAQLPVSIIKKHIGNNCEIDQDATQKYTLIRTWVLKNEETVESSLLVRGNRFAEYHKETCRSLIHTINNLEVGGMSFRYSVLGGGRIKHDSATKTILIYGYSYGFPWRDGEFRHDLAKKVVLERFPEFNVETSNAGY